MNIEVPFKPSHLILQDFTGLPAVAVFGAMCNAVKKLGGDLEKRNTVWSADPVNNHFIQVNFKKTDTEESRPGI